MPVGYLNRNCLAALGAMGRERKRVKPLAGFTIVELLTVLLIISLLFVLSMPSYLKTVEEAKKRTAKTALELLRNGELIYYVDTNECLPFSNTSLDKDNDATRNSLKVNVYNDSDWVYDASLADPGLLINIIAYRQRGPCQGKTITLTIASSDGTYAITDYDWPTCN